MNYLRNNIRRFNFEQVYNLRELGGYPIGKNKSTKWQTFLRADCLSQLTEEEGRQLVAYGLETVIDLRFPDEVAVAKNPLSEYSEITYHQISLKGAGVDHLIIKEQTLGEMYTSFIVDELFIKQIFMTLAESKGITLFHCSAGKDRTGITAALLLLLVGVSKEDVIADYQITNVYLQPKFATHWQELPADMLHLLDSHPDSIRYFIAELEKEYQTVENFLLKVGVTEKAIHQLKEKFVVI